MDTACLDRQSVRPKIARVWAAAAGEGRKGPGEGPARGFRLHGGIFPLGHSWDELCPGSGGGSIPVIFLSTWPL